MAVEMAKDVVMPAPSRSVRVRAALAIALIAVLSVQCVVALASPKTYQKSARPVYQEQAPTRGEAHRPATGYPYPKGKDPRSC